MILYLLLLSWKRSSFSFKIIWSFSKIVAPLTDLIRPTNQPLQFILPSAAEGAFQVLISTHFATDVTRPFIAGVIASEVGAGAVLSQTSLGFTHAAASSKNLTSHNSLMGLETENFCNT